MEFKDRTIILGVTGGIAIHKSLEIASQLIKSDAALHVVMTQNAARLVQPLQFQVISRNPVLLNLFDAGTDWKPPHIDLADRAELLAIVPATANLIGKLANGIADDALSTVAVSVHCPILIAPAMNGHMYHNPFVQENIDRLKTHGFHFVEPASGDLACGYEGIGRLNTVETIVQRIGDILSMPRIDTTTKKAEDMKGTRVLVTAGATREYIDPVRFITNPSSGKMGYAIAEAAASRGAEVCLVSGNATVAPPIGIEIRHVETTLDMHHAVLQVFPEVDIVIMAGAPTDYRPRDFAPHKIKKSTDPLILSLERNPDIAETLGEQKTHQTLVCFAAETEELLENAKKKLIHKNCDLIVANDILEVGAGFQSDTNIVTLLDRHSTYEQLPRAPKRDIADAILTKVVAIRNSRKAGLQALLQDESTAGP